jgi:muconate cycloisomerase
MADESATSRASLQALAASGACNGVNVRISKCGGLVAAHSRCREVLERGWLLQVGCHVGESSLLSTAQLILLDACPGVRYAEGCYGKHLLRADPFTPLLQFGYGGGRPDPPRRPGLGVDVDEGRLARWTVRRRLVATS